MTIIMVLKTLKVLFMKNMVVGFNGRCCIFF